MTFEGNEAVFNDLPEEGEEELETKGDGGKDGEEEKDESKNSPDIEKLNRKINTITKKYDKSVKVIEDLRSKLYSKKGEEPATLTDEEKKELQAQEYIKKQAREMLKELEKEKSAEEDKVTEEFQEELDEVLEENPEVTEKELLDICEEYEVSPQKALKILKNFEKKKDEGKKPKSPSPKRGEAEVKAPDSSKKLEGKSFDEKMSIVSRDSKDWLRKMLKK